MLLFECARFGLGLPAFSTILILSPLGVVFMSKKGASGSAARRSCGQPCLAHIPYP